MTLEANLWSLIQGLSGGRIYQTRLPQGVTYPAVDFRIFDGTPIQSQTSTLRNPRLRFNVYAKDPDDLVAGVNEIIGVLNHHTGSFSALWEGEMDLQDPETGLYHRVIDFRVWSN